MKIKLTQLKAGQAGKVLSVEGGCGVLRNIENIGIRPDKVVKKVSQQLAKGPVVVQIGKAQIAIGHGLAEKIWVEAQSS